MRSEVLSLREKEYVEAATSIGVKKWVIMMRHILPNCMPTLIVMLTNHIPGNILTESSLSFLGIGAQPPMTSWGLMVYQTKSYLDRNPTITLAPGRGSPSSSVMVPVTVILPGGWAQRAVPASRRTNAMTNLLFIEGGIDVEQKCLIMSFFLLR